MPPEIQSKSKILPTILITAVVVGTLTYLVTAYLYQNDIGLDKNIENKEYVTMPHGNPSEYSLISYPQTESSVYNKFDERCTDSYYDSYKDYKLVRNQTEVVVPSLIEFLAEAANEEPTCADVPLIFAAPIDGQYLYMNKYFSKENDSPSSGVGTIFRLDLSDLTTKELQSSKLIRDTDGGYSTNGYEVLSDGKRVIKWNMNGVFLVNLETDTVTSLYKVKKDQWLVSGIYLGELGNGFGYDVKLVDDQLLFGVYDKKAAIDNKDVVEDQDGVRIPGYGNEIIRPKLIERVTIDIPAR